MHAAILSLGLAAAATLTSAEPAKESDVKDLLEQVPEPALHEALHELYPAFKDGIFEADRSAAEAVSSDDPSLASKIIAAASHADILKRQFPNSNSTTTSSSRSSTSSSSSSSATESSPSPTLPAPTTGDSGGSSTVTPPDQASPTSADSSTSSSDVLPDPFPSVGSSTVSSSTPITSSSRSSSSSSMSSSVPPMVITSTSSGVVTAVTGAGDSVVSSTSLLTTTLPNGEQSTMTSVAVITPTVQGADSPGQPTGSSTQAANPSLVTGNAAATSFRLGREAVALVAGAAGVAWLL